VNSIREEIAAQDTQTRDTMTLTIQLEPDEEARLAAAARREGLDPASLVRKLMIEHLPPVTQSVEEEDPTLALFAQWDREDAQMTPEEIEAARREFEEFKQNINAERTRSGARLIYP
jgi:hypothetical protein